MADPPNINPISQIILAESQKLVGNLSDEIWENEPVSFRRFVTDSFFLNLPALTEIQYTDLEMLLGTDPKNVFTDQSMYNLFVLVAGKGSGKDYLASIAIAYCFYLLMLMKSPHKFLEWPIGESIDILIVSYSDEQAMLGPFDKIKQRLLNCMWFKNNFTIILGDKGAINPKGKREIVIHRDRIVAHNNVRIMSEHSKNESFEGYNVLFFLMSEASAFRSDTKERNADKVFSTLRTSANTRFPGKRWKGMIVSWPRTDEDNDFTLSLYKTALQDKTAWVRLTTSWDYKPARLYSGEKFEYNLDGEIFWIPIEYKEDFEKFPDDSRAKHLCRPVKGGRRPFDPGLILHSVGNKLSCFTFEQYIADGRVKMKILGMDNKAKFIGEEYLITVDLGKIHSAAALCLQHWDRRTGYVQDAIGCWTPEKDCPVDFVDVEDWLVKLAEFIPNVRIGFDQWNAELFIARLSQRRIQAFEYHVRSKHGEDYDMFQKAMGGKSIVLLNHKELLLQLSAIKVDADGEIFLDKKITGRKDLVDATVGGFKVLLKENQQFDTLGGQYITNNMSSLGGSFIKRNIP